MAAAASHTGGDAGEEAQGAQERAVEGGPDATRQASSMGREQGAAPAAEEARAEEDSAVAFAVEAAGVAVGGCDDGAKGPTQHAATSAQPSARHEGSVPGGVRGRTATV